MPSDVKQFEMRGKMSWQLLAPRRRRGGDASLKRTAAVCPWKRWHLKRKGSSEKIGSIFRDWRRFGCFRDGDGGKLLIFLLFWVGTNDLRWVVFKRLYVFVNWGLKNWLIEIERWFFEFGFLVVLCQTLILSIHPCLLHFTASISCETSLCIPVKDGKPWIFGCAGFGPTVKIMFRLYTYPNYVLGMNHVVASSNMEKSKLQEVLQGENVVTIPVRSLYIWAKAYHGVSLHRA